MQVALYARVSSERQEQRGTIASQLDALMRWAREQDHDVVDAYVCVDDGYSGARLDRPGLDRLRDGAEAEAFEAVLVLCPDRLARKYAYQVLILEELERFGVQVIFLDQPLSDDPQARLLTQIQGAVAEYERMKIAERYRRGKLFRAPRRGVLVEGPLRLPADSTPGRRSGPRRGIRARGAGRAAGLPLARRRPPQRAPDRAALDRVAAGDRYGTSALGNEHRDPDAAQRGLHRHDVLQPQRVGQRRAEVQNTAPPPAQPPAGPRGGRVDSSPGAPDHRRRDVSSFPVDSSRQQSFQSAPSQVQPLPAPRRGPLPRV